MRILLTVCCAFLMDLLLGDPEKLMPLHPVVWMGHVIYSLEKILRRGLPKNRRGELVGGILMAVLLPTGTLLLSVLLLRLARRIWLPLGYSLECVWCWQALAARNLWDEAMNVYHMLRTGTLGEARNAVARIVGRDTANLDCSAVVRAAVETVAENFSDGIAAPMLCMLLGGAPLALCYKAVNTMDSMVGYRNERYLWFGRAAAKLDDAVNYLPARMAALMLIASAVLCGEDGREAFRIWRRDRHCHPSPNAGECEAVMAGALHLRLCGPASYFGKQTDKPWIGDAGRDSEAEDICRACYMERIGSCLCLALLCLLRLCIMLLMRTGKW